MFYITTEIRISGIESLKKKSVNDALKAAWYAVAKRWRRRYLPLHFGYGAEKRYNYTPRSYTYDRRKRRYLNHDRPLEFSGEGRSEALYRENISATRFLSKVRLPRKFNLRPKGGLVNMAEEIRRVLPAEQAELTKFWIEQVERELRNRGAAAPWVYPAGGAAGAAA